MQFTASRRFSRICSRSSSPLPPFATRLATAGDDQTVRLWHTPFRWLALFVPLPEEGWASFFPDGRYHVQGNPAGRVWHTVKLSRFEVGELDPAALRRGHPG